MGNPNVHSEREKDRLEEFRESIQICTSQMSAPLYISFWLADLVYAPHLKFEFLAMRLFMLPVNLLVFWFARKIQSLRTMQYLGLVFAFLNGIMITAMIYLTEGLSSPYYAGLNLVALGIFSFFPWTMIMRFSVAAVIFGPYVIFAFFSQPSTEDLKIAYIHAFFMVSTVLVSFFIRHFREKLRNREFELRDKLNTEIKNREKIIDARTKESVRLGNLSKQFSPQVVYAIQEGSIELSRGVHRAEICAIFIDIVNSTDRIVRLDKDEVTQTISLFMEDTMRVLLKYDITIDKFVGDEVVGFSNDPMKHKDYVQRVVDAALEIKARVIQNQDQYLETWLQDFQIRIGISSGFANVGFYGSEEYFRSYTAIGRPMNLAARLCARAEPNQILIANDAAKKLPSKAYDLSSMGELKLKGFESDKLRIYQLGEEQVKTGETEISKCPNGHGILHLDTNSKGLYVFKCRVCQYEMDQEPVEKKKAA